MPPRLLTPLPEIPQASPAEVYLAQAIHRQFDSEWSVAFRLPFQTTDRMDVERRGDIDALLYHRQHGFLVIEIKGGGIRRDNQGWVSQGNSGTHRIEDPVDQAQKSLYVLSARLRDLAKPFQADRLCYPPRVEWMVAFPDTSSSDPVGLQLSRDHCILKPDMENLVEKVLGGFAAYSGWNHVPAEPTWERVFLTDLAPPTIPTGPRLVAHLDADQTLIELATRAQRRVIEAFSNADRLDVEGSAGSGKTVLAVHLAQRWAREGRTLYLCFNKLLAESVAQRNPWLEALTFHDFARRQIVQTGGIWPDNVPQGFWETVPDLLDTALDRSTEPLWDAIVVDEAQDFETTWWLVIEKLMDSQGRRRLARFHDPRQNLYRRDPLPAIEGVRLSLPTGVRSSKRISEWIGTQAGFPLEPDELVPEGMAPRSMTLASASATNETVRKELHTLLVEEKVPPERVLVVSLHGRDKSALRDFRHDRAAWCLPPDGRIPGVVNIVSAYRAKGLEADVVLLVDVEPEANPNTLYVAASRARQRLVVLRVPGTPTEG